MKEYININSVIDKDGLHLSSRVKYGDDKPEDYSCHVWWEEIPGNNERMHLHIGELWLSLDLAEYLEVEKWFNNITAMVDAGEDPSGETLVCGVYFEVYDDDRIGIYLHDRLLRASELLDRAFLKYISDYLKVIREKAFSKIAEE